MICWKSGFGMGFNKEVSEKRDCPKSKKSFHNDTNIEIKVTLKIIT